MPTYQADAIVLRRLDYGEADRIVTLLTREHGKLAAIAKGARRGKSRVSGSLDLFERSTMMLAKGRNLDVVAQVAARQPPYGAIKAAVIHYTHAPCGWAQLNGVRYQ